MTSLGWNRAIGGLVALAGIVVWASCYANGDPPKDPPGCTPKSATCCTSPVNVNLTADRPPACETFRSGEEGQAGGENQAAVEAMRVYTEIAKNSEQFYEDAFHQIVIILGVVGVIIGVFLLSEHRSFEGYEKTDRVHDQSSCGRGTGAGTPEV